MKHPIGTYCKSLDHSEVIAGLEKLASNEEYYAKMANNMVEMANSELSLENFHKQFADFVGLDKNTIPLFEKNS